MGYIYILVVALIVVPILFLAVTRRTRAGAGFEQRDRGMTVSKPSSDQPEPRADAINQPAPGAERRLPPG